MALNSISAELLLHCRRLQPSAADFLMLGRQWLRLSPAEASRLGHEHRLKLDDLADAQMTDTTYAEPFFQRMGFQKVEALDVTTYQGAGLVHDMNTALPTEHHGKWDWVFDGGSLEHIFDFPTAIRNCAALLKPGGLFITQCPVNNWMGHGFYQFSPELFYRTFAKAHGFRVRFAALVSHTNPLVFHALKDPADTGKRLQFNPEERLSLLFVAEKGVGAQIGEVQQSDYSVRWNEGREDEKTEKPAGKPSSIAALIPTPFRRRLSEWRIKQRRHRENTRGMTRCATMSEAWALATKN